MRSPRNLLELYYASVGRGASLLLNLPPDRRGRIHENDVRSLREFRRLLDATFATNLAGAMLADGVLDLGRPVTFNVVRLREDIALGQGVETLALDQWQDGRWNEFAAGTSIGNCRLVRTAPVTTTKVRARTTPGAMLMEVALFAEATR